MPNYSRTRNHVKAKVLVDENHGYGFTFYGIPILLSWLQLI